MNTPIQKTVFTASILTALTISTSISADNKSPVIEGFDSDALNTIALTKAQAETQSQRRFKTKFGLERSGNSILNFFDDKEANGISPYFQATYGNPYGLDFTARASYNLGHDTLEDFPMEASDIGIPVRSDIRAYRQEAITLDRLYAKYSMSMGENLYARVTAGLLQTQFSGAQLELIYAPKTSPFALGAEVAKVQKRDPEDIFGTLDYEVITGHVTAYYDTGYPGFLLSASYGQYLAEDMGTTITAAKRFQNGWEVRGEITATEYFFDAEENAGDYILPKISIYIPLGLIGRSGRFDFNKLASSSTDAGRKLVVSESLYGSLRGYEAKGYNARWGGF